MLLDQITRLERLKDGLKEIDNTFGKIEFLNADPVVKGFLEDFGKEAIFISIASPECELIIKEIIAIGQGDILKQKKDFFVFLRKLIDDLIPVENFYKPLGGIVWYQWMAIKTMEEKSGDITYKKPKIVDISKITPEVKNFIIKGILELPKLVEFYPIGGAADRLGLFDKITGTRLPAAELCLHDNSLLEGLIQDLKAREYLYYKVTQKRVSVPVVIMTSDENDNHSKIQGLLERHDWFGKNKGDFYFIKQPLVPVVDKEFSWHLKEGNRLLMKPGGHGAFWRIAFLEKIFEKLIDRGCEKALIRQINNPVAGVDYGILAFLGYGFLKNKSFGFASCDKKPNASEGIDILSEKRTSEKTELSYVNLEYCNFAKYGIGEGDFLANTNILFADLKHIKNILDNGYTLEPLINLRKIGYKDIYGQDNEIEGTRLELLIQDIAKAFSAETEEDLASFITYNKREKTIAAIKFSEGAQDETTRSSLATIQKNNRALLEEDCKFKILGQIFFIYHPALGPLYSIIAQKLRGGVIKNMSELVLMVAELDIENLYLDGSLKISANSIMEDPGKCVLKNVVIKNNCSIILGKNAKFYAEDVTLDNFKIEVPDNSTEVRTKHGHWLRNKEWEYQIKENDVVLS